MTWGMRVKLRLEALHKTRYDVLITELIMLQLFPVADLPRSLRSAQSPTGARH